MSQIKKIGSRMEVTPKPEKIGNVTPAERLDDVVVLSQIGTSSSGIKRGRYHFEVANGLSQNIPHGMSSTPTVFIVTLENGNTQPYTAGISGGNIVFTFIDAGIFAEFYINWVVFG